MRPFDYSAATDIAGATRLAAASTNTRFIAGGTTLVDLMKLDIETSSRRAASSTSTGSARATRT